MRYAILVIFLFLLASCSEELPPTPPSPGGEQQVAGRAAGLPISQLPTWASSLKYTDIEPTTVKYGDTERTIVQKPSGFKNKFYVYGFKYVYNRKFGFWEKLPANAGQSGKVVKDWVEDKAVFLLPVTSERFPEGPNFEVVYTCADTGGRDNNSRIIWDCNGNKWMLAAFNVGERYPNILFEEKIGTNNYTRSSKSTSSNGDVYEAEYVDTSNVKTIAQVISLNNAAAYKQNLAGAVSTLQNQWTTRNNVCGFLTTGSNEVKFSWSSSNYWVTIKTLSSSIDDSKITKYNTRYNSNCNLLNELRNISAPVVVNITNVTITNVTNITVVNVTNVTPVVNITNVTPVVNVTPPPPFTKILINKTAPQFAKNGTQINYTITVSNLGTGNATNVVVVDYAAVFIAADVVIPDSVVFDSSSPSPTSGDNTFNIGTLAANGLTTITIAANVSSELSAGMIINNTAYVSFTNSTGNYTLDASALTTVLVPARFAGKITTCSLDRGTGVYPGIAWYSQGQCVFGTCPPTQCAPGVNIGVSCTVSQVGNSCYQPITIGINGLVTTNNYKFTCIQSPKCTPADCPSGMTDLGIIDEYNARGQRYNGYRVCQLGSVQGEMVSCQGSACTLPSCSKGTLQAQFSEYDENAVFAKFGICSDKSIELASCQQSTEGRTCVTSQPAGKIRFENYVIDINWISSASRTFTYWDFYSTVPEAVISFAGQNTLPIDYHRIEPITGLVAATALPAESVTQTPVTSYFIMDAPSSRSTQIALTFLAAFGILLIVLLNFSHKDE